jgi:lipoprotein-releasing system permease protein
MKLPVELFLALRYLRPRRTFVSVITVFSFLGVTLGVGALIVVLSVMAGFEQQVTEKIVGFNAHITVGMADGSVLVKFHDKLSPAYIKSVPAEGDDPVLPLKKYLKMGEYELRGDSVLIGKEWSKRYGAFPGDKIDIFGPRFLQGIGAKPGEITDHPLPEEPIIRGVFETGRFDFDLDFLLVSTELAQQIWGMPDGVHGIAVRVTSLDDAEAVKNSLNQILPQTLHARTWMDDNRDLYNQIGVERVVMACILCLILVVAAFGLCSTLITTTVQKSREIGLMKALGANDYQVCNVFLLHGTVVGVVGTVAGTLVGLLFLRNLNVIRDFILYAFHIQVFAGSVYGLPEIPAVVSPTQIVIIDLSAVVICVLAALIPAASAARLAPARALRYE